MKVMSKILLLTTVAIVSDAALAQTQSADTAPTAWLHQNSSQPGNLDPVKPQAPFVSPDTPQGTGPYPAIMATEPGAERFTAYYPADLAKLGKKKLPLVFFANGSCSYRGSSSRQFLTEIASHGYFALAAGPMGDVKPPPPAKPGPTDITRRNLPMQNPEARRPVDLHPLPRGDHELLSEGIDWLIAENSRPASKWYHRLDTANTAMMGESCGGNIAATFGSDPRVKTIALWSGGTHLNMTLGETIQKPILIITGDGRYDPDFYSGVSAFEAIKKQVVFYAWRVNAIHVGMNGQANGGEGAPIAVAWLDWRFKNERTAAKMFQGENCGVCTNPHWHVQKRHIDPEVH